MNKNIFFGLTLVILLVGVSCKKDDNTNTITPYDHEAQLPKDRDSLIKYLSTHYYNPNDENIYTIGNDEGLPIGEQIPLNRDSNLDSIEGIEANGTVATYKMYYYTIQEGVDNGNVGYSSPSPVDSVFVKYRGQLQDSTVFDEREDHPIWFQLSNTIEGWGRGLPYFKRGTYSVVGNDFIFENPGKGYIFFPSGLGYKNVGASGVPSNSNLIFKVELDDVNLIDTDLDGVPTKFELSIDAAGNITTFDTDGDGFDDYQDVGDDKDKASTLVEVYYEYVYQKDGDGNVIGEKFDPRGNIDFTYDANGNIIGINGGTPNYLNPNVVPPGYEE